MHGLDCNERCYCEAELSQIFSILARRPQKSGDSNHVVYPRMGRSDRGKKSVGTSREKRRVAKDHGMRRSEQIQGPIFCYDHGSLDVFLNKDEAESYYEPWIINEGLEFFDRNGFRLVPEPDNEDYRIVLRNAALEDENAPERLRSILVETSAYWNERPENHESLGLEEWVKWCTQHMKSL